MNCYDSNFATLNFIKKTKTLEIIWKDYDLKSEDYRFILQKALALIIEYNAKSWISDLTLQKPISEEDSKWVEANIIPIAIKNGISKAAFVVSANHFKKLYSNNLAKNISSAGFVFEYFNSREEALKWI